MSAIVQIPDFSESGQQYLENKKDKGLRDNFYGDVENFFNFYDEMKTDPNMVKQIKKFLEDRKRIIDIYRRRGLFTKKMSERIKDIETGAVKEKNLKSALPMLPSDIWDPDNYKTAQRMRTRALSIGHASNASTGMYGEGPKLMDSIATNERTRTGDKK
jgi:hypothetical protein